jgi:hypothetical protein
MRRFLIAATAVVLAGMVAIAARPPKPRFLLPGLIDMHVHQPVAVGGLTEYFALLYLKHGVTAVRDMGNFYPEVFAHRAAIERGELPGPRTFTCGAIIDGDPPVWDHALVAATVEAGQALVQRLAAQGADCIKVYSRVTTPVLHAIRNTAHELGLPVVGHVPECVPFEVARLDDAQHLIGVAQTGIPCSGVNPMIAGWAELNPARLDHIARISQRHGIAHTPTLVFLDYNARRDQHDRLLALGESDYLPRLFREVFWRPRDAIRLGGSRTTDQEALRVGYAHARTAVRALHEAGVRVHAGTDTGNPFVVPGASLHEELRQLVAAGFSVESAWMSATVLPGASLGTPGLGRLQVGAPADLLVFSDDPTGDLAALDSLTAVIADGRIYTRQDLDTAVERYRRYYHGFFWDKLLLGVARLLR